LECVNLFNVKIEKLNLTGLSFRQAFFILILDRTCQHLLIQFII